MARCSVRSVTEWVSDPASSSKPATGFLTSKTICMQATPVSAASRKWLGPGSDERLVLVIKLPAEVILGRFFEPVARQYDAVRLFVALVLTSTFPNQIEDLQATL